MSTFDKFCNSIFNNKWELSESVIDIARNSIDPTVWEFPEDNLPIIRPTIKLQILDIIEAIDRITPVVKFYIVGSILTKQYSPNSDIDVNVEIDPEIDDLTRETLFQFIKRANGSLAIGTTHPINYFIVQEEFDFDKSQGVYDLANEKWLKIPEDTDIEIDSYFNKFQNAVNGIDITTAELRRDLIDYEMLKNLSPDQVAKLGDLSAKKLDEIEDDMQFLIKAYHDVHHLRKWAFEQEMTPSEIKKFGKKYKLPENVVYKMLEKYYYIEFIKKLENILGDEEELSNSDINKIKKAGAEFWNK